MIGNAEYIAISLLLVFIVVAIIFVIAQQRTLQLIEPAYRSMSPRQVWLQMIPAFGTAWSFVIVAQISRSIQKQLAAEDENSILGSTVDPNHRPTYHIGIAYCFFITAGTLLALLKSFGVYSVAISLSGTVLNVIGMGAWIGYWVQLEKYKKILRLRSAGSIA